MSSVVRGNFRMAMASLKGTKWRSGITMLGVMVAVVPVLMILGIGEGVKREITNQVSYLGKDLLVIRPGSLGNGSSATAQFTALNGFSSAGAFTKNDYEMVKKQPAVGEISPIALVPGAISAAGNTVKQPLVIGVSPDFNSLVAQKVRHGDGFTAGDENRRVAMLGREAAVEIFKDAIPIGRSFTFRGETYVVRGILEESSAAPMSFNANYNKAVVIPYRVASELTGSTAIAEMLVRPAKGVPLDKAEKDITAALRESRGGTEDFSVLTQAENMRVANNILTMLTGLVAAVAAVALLVSGISIMNIMLVTVTERMHEIGVRKAIGATKRQIMGQFVAEATLLSIGGGIIGITIAFILEYLLGVFTTIQPIITWQAVVVVFGLTVLLGVIFGVVPAIKAARKDPIAALRHE